MAVYETGYEDEQFEHIVGQSLHCAICTNVFKDPVMCRHNEHIFCRCCITIHLMNYQTCPSCMEPLTVQTLKKAPRAVTNLLSELRIRCEFFYRGCGKFIELGNLKRHVRECGFAPAVCSNEGCQLVVNKHDLLHHETAVCELRRVKCHSCNDIRQEMGTVKVNLAAMNVKLDRNEKKFSEKLQSNKDIIKAVEKKVVEEVKVVKKQLNKQEESNRQLKADNEEMKKSLNEITRQLRRMTQQTSHEVEAEQEQMKKGIAEADDMDREPNVIIAGGWNEGGNLNSVEMFNLSNRTWTPLQPMKKCHSGASSVIYNDQMILVGGYDTDGGTKSMETLSLNAVEADRSITWQNFPAELPEQLFGHCSVVYNGQLIVIGGYNVNEAAYSVSITEISLVPPYTSKLLATMPKAIGYHGALLFDDKIVIVGGRLSLGSVLLYDITSNVLTKLASLPYHVGEMAIVKWGDNFIIMGGANNKLKPMRKVLIYNIKSQKSYLLPEMIHKREGCVAAVVKDTVIVMGGKDETGSYLKSAECFRFDRYTWEDLPGMHEARYLASAVLF